MITRISTIGTTTNSSTRMAGMSTAYGPLEARVRAARRSSDRVLLEGVHAVKHALRFGADVEVVATPDLAGTRSLLAELAPDVTLPGSTVEVDAATWLALVNGRELPSPALSVAVRPDVGADDVLAAAGRVVVLESPRHLGNLGAVVRVAAAADAAGVLVVGDADPWHPTAVRAAAGLQFALPVARVDALPATTRPIVAIDAAGEPLGSLPDDGLLLFGTERGGLSVGLRRRADRHAAIPMRAGVSSLNLATAAAVVLFTR
jgi:RNA methyltransferase, TrmH family